MKTAIWYRNGWLAKNSQAYLLYQEALKTSDYKALDKHLKQVDQKARELLA